MRKTNNGMKFPNRKRPPQFSEEHKNNISNALKGKDPKNRASLYTPELNEKRRRKMLGQQHTLGYKHTDETRKKISETLKGIKRKPFSDEHRQKLSKALMGRYVGEKSPTWRGGKSYEDYSGEWTETLRRSIRERDNYVCRLCFSLQGDVAYDVHHIDYDKKNCNPDNLITLCHPCHSKTNNHRKYWLKFFNKLK